METFELRSVSFAYPDRSQYAIHDLSLTICAGDLVVLCGPSGCGKSTLLRQLKPILAPHGKKSGEIFFEGQPLDSLSQRAQAEKIGFVQQSPDNQIVTDKVWHELAFGLESLGLDSSTIRKRVAEMASFFGIEGWFYKNVTDLSGGQKQLLNLASVMVMQPSVLILDEPTSQLDPIAASDFLATLGKINRELGTTVILTEHRLEEAFPLANKVAVMDKGKLLCVGNPVEVGKLLKAQGHSMFLAMPTAMRVWGAVESDSDCPITVRDGRQWLWDYARSHGLRNLPQEAIPVSSEQIAICAKELWFKYEKDAPDVVRGVDMRVHKGEFLAILGGNGTGKSTSLKLLSGLLKPYRGSVTVQGLVGVLPQDPQALFVKKTVRKDLEEISQTIDEVVRLCRLEALLERHPYDLSGGEQQRAALAKVLLLAPDVLLLDEPTKGLDAEFKEVFAEILQTLLCRGVTIVMVSHDVEFCARYAHRCAMFFDGSIVTQASPRDFFGGNSFYTTSANRMARGVTPSAVTAEDLIEVCGGAVSRFEPSKHDFEPTKKEPSSAPKTKKNLPKRTIVSAVLILLLIPLTLFVGETYFAGRKYLAISLLVMLEMMLPFFLVFEGRKPQARELVIIAVLCAIGVAGRAAFFMLPEFKPVWALTIIAGVAFGGETGFVVGAMTMLSSNVLFGQGPWTPWQMFAMGIIGFLAGVLFRKGLLGRKRLPLCIFGAVSCIVIYGGIMNPASAVMYLHTLSWKAVLPYFISGFPVDCVHAAATWIFLWFAAEPMLEKLSRIKVKYSLLEQ